MNDFYTQLQEVRSGLVRRWAWLFAFAGLTFIALLILGAQAVEVAESWRESSAGQVLFFLVLGALIIEVGVGLWLWPKRPSTMALARRLDRAMPGSRDRFSCAVELRESGDEPPPLGRLVLRQAETAAGDEALWQRLHPRWVKGWALGVAAVLAAVLLAFAARTEVAAKAAYAWGALFEVDPGLTVAPGDREVPIGTDLEITAEIHRWEREAEIELRRASGVERYPMFADGQGPGVAFTAYGVKAAFDYRILTPSLQSPWYRIDAYPPPELDGVDVQITPPAYTGLEPSAYELKAPRDFEAPEGAVVDVEIASAHAETVQWVNAEETLASGFAFSWVADRDTTGWLRLVDAAGRQAVTDSFTFSVIPDEPPVVDVLEPGEDSSVRLGEVLPLEVYAADDYGVSRVSLQTAVAGMDRPPRELYNAESDSWRSREAEEGATPAFEREVTLLRSIDPEELAAENQSLLTYYVEAADNREPEPQVTRSELFFVEIREPIDPGELSESQMQAAEGAEQAEVNLRAMLMELRRLIRQTHALPMTPENQRERQAAETSAGLGTLGNELQNLFAQVGPMLSVLEGGEFATLLQDAIELLSIAERQVAERDATNALMNEQEAYTYLLMVEAFLQAVSQQQQQQQQGGSGGPSQQQAQGEQQEQPSEPLSERLAEARQELLEAAEAQGNLNDTYEALGEPTRNEATELFNEQREVANQMREALENVGDLLEQAPSLQQGAQRAQARMGDAATAISRRDSGSAGRQGMRARSEMLDLAAGLEQARQAVLSQEVRQLADSAAQLSQQQGSLGQRAGGTSPDDEAELQAQRSEQQQLQERLSELLRGARDRAGSLAADSPELAEGIREGVEEVRNAQTESAMERAGNALLYGSPEAASRLQQGASEQLGQFAEQLRETAGSMDGGMGELLSLLQEVEAQRQLLQRQSGLEGQQAGQSEQARQGGPGEQDQEGEQGQAGQQGQGAEGQQGQAQAQGSGQGESQGRGESQGQGQQGQPGGESGQTRDPDLQAAQRLGERLGNAGERTGSGGLGRVGRALQDADSAGRSDQLLQQAGRLLLRELLRQRAEQATTGRGMNAPIPEGYREMVEDYFRSLAVEPE